MDFVVQMSGQVIDGSITPEMINSFSWGFGAMLWAFLWGLGVLVMVLYIALLVFMIVCKWRIFEKAWLPGWGILIPFYNIYLQFKLAGRPGWWTRWILFSPVLLVLMIIAMFDTAKRFNKHWAFGFGLLFLPVIFEAILAFDKSKYLPKK